MDDKTFERIYRESKPLKSFWEIYFECNVKPLYEQRLKEDHLQEMAESTSKQLGITFAGITDGKIYNKIDNPLSDAEIEDTTKQTVNKYGAGGNFFTLKFTEEENKSQNRKVGLYNALSNWLNQLIP